MGPGGQDVYPLVPGPTLADAPISVPGQTVVYATIVSVSTNVLFSNTRQSRLLEGQAVIVALRVEETVDVVKRTTLSVLRRFGELKYEIIESRAGRFNLVLESPTVSVGPAVCARVLADVCTSTLPLRIRLVWANNSSWKSSVIQRLVTM